MKKRAVKSSEAEAMEASAAQHDVVCYVLRLYVAGSTPNCRRAIANIRKICEEHLGGRYDLDIVDIVSEPALAASKQLFAAPTLIKESPLPIRRFIGDMAQTERILHGLDLSKPAANAALATSR
jgi:circadian clock protein KaiB